MNEISDYSHIWWIQALEGKDIKEIMTNVGSGGGAAPAAAAPAGGEEAAAPAEDKKKEEGKW